jgi:hypothetical protein
MRVEKRQELGRPFAFLNGNGDEKRTTAWHMVSEPTPAETQTQVGQSLNGGDAHFTPEEVSEFDRKKNR